VTDGCEAVFGGISEQTTTAKKRNTHGGEEPSFASEAS
jgi:hypothetical protein